MASGLAIRVAAVAVLALLLAVLAAALALSRRRPRQDGEARAPFLAHVEELRRRILRVAAVLVAVTTLAMVVRVEAWHGLPVPVPALYDTVSAQAFRAMAAHLVPAGVRLVVTSPLDGFSAQMGIAFALGAAAALPVALYELGRFAAPALRPGEGRMLARAVLPSLVLFLAGAALAYVWVLPVTLDALYGFSDALGAEGLLAVADLTGFTLAFLFGFGLAFQLPLVMALLSRVGLVDPAWYLRHWRHAVIIVLVVAMVVTPDPTIVSQLMLAAPLLVLYALGIVLARRAGAKRDAAG